MVVLNGGKWRLYYDHWCANRLDAELFWGPEMAREFIEQREDHGRWLDEVWCEGAALLDFDARVLLFFGGEDTLYDLPSRRAHLALMTVNWPGWRILWAHKGIVSIADYLEVDPRPFKARDAREERGSFVHDVEDREANSVLLTTMRDGVATAFRVRGEEDCIESGPAALDRLDAIPPMPSLMWEGEFPSGGIHADFDRRAMSFWWTPPSASLQGKAAAAWRGWSVQWLLDEVERHIALSGLDIRLPFTPIAELQSRIITMLRYCHHDVGPNPAADLIRLRDLNPVGGTLRFNPETRVTRASAGSLADKLAVLDHLAARLPIGLPPHH